MSTTEHPLEFRYILMMQVAVFDILRVDNHECAIVIKPQQPGSQYTYKIAGE